VKDSSGEAFGVVVARVPFARINEIVQQAGEIHSAKGDMAIDLIANNGTLLYSTYNNKGILKDNLSGCDAMARVSRGEKSGSGRDFYLNKGGSIYTFAREQGYLDFPGNGWTLVIHVPVKAAFAPIEQWRSHSLALLAPLVILSLLAVLWFARSICRPIIRLQEAAAQVGRGNDHGCGTSRCRG